LRRATCAVLSFAFVVLLAPAAFAAPKDKDAYNTLGLRKAITVSELLQHENALQGIANANIFDGVTTRESGTPGYAASRDFIVSRLQAAGYDPVVQPFEFDFFKLLAPPTFERVSPQPRVYSFTGNEFSPMTYSGSGDVTKPTTNVLDTGGAIAGAGCETPDFNGFPVGNIALIQRGACTFKIKATNAIAAGASGVVIYNNTPTDPNQPLNGTLGSVGQNVPVIGTTFAIGSEIVTLLGGNTVTLHLVTSTLSDRRTTWNVLADTAGGRSDRVIVVGAHLDSRLEGPGINDNGSGSSAVLEIAEQFAKRDVEPRNKVRFAWWGAEEFNLLGSTAYVNSLSDEDLADIEANLNFDMLASPNYVRFIYDGDNSAFPPSGTTVLEGPDGSGLIEDVFSQYFANQDLPSSPTPFNGRSDYGPFIASGIPAGGLFSGAEGIKTAAEAQAYGGQAGVAYDHCYHLLCDDINNLNLKGFEELADAAAHATYTLAMTPYEIKNGNPVRNGAHGTPSGGSSSAGSASGGHDRAVASRATKSRFARAFSRLRYRGPLAVR
jgi:Zn-dependent M28 family amino/carboxypeptidase